MMGPALGVKGGIASVERLLLPALAPYARVEFVPTMTDVSHIRKFTVFAKALVRLRRRLHEFPRPIVHIHFASRGSTLRKLILAEMACRSGAPLIMHAHGAAFHRFYVAQPRLIQGRIRRILSKASYVIVLSEWWRRFYGEHLKIERSRLQVFHNPVHVPELPPTTPLPPPVRFLFMGRLGQRKGTFDLLKAFAMAGGEGTILTLAGDGDLKSALKQAKNLGIADRVEITGWVSPPRRDELLAQNDVLVLPSYDEGLPMALLEAMANALPVIATPVGGIPDVLKDGVSGRVVDPGDVGSLAAAITEIASDAEKRRAMGMAGRRAAMALSPERYAERLSGIYAGLWRLS